MTDTQPRWTLTVEADGDGAAYFLRSYGTTWASLPVADEPMWRRALPALNGIEPPRRFTAEVSGRRTVYVNITDTEGGEVYTAGPFADEDHGTPDHETAAAFVAEFMAPRHPSPPAEDVEVFMVEGGMGNARLFTDLAESRRYSNDISGGNKRWSRHPIRIKASTPAEDLPPGVVRYDADTLIARGDVVRTLPDGEWERRASALFVWEPPSGQEGPSALFEVRRIQTPAVEQVPLHKLAGRVMPDMGSEDAVTDWDANWQSRQVTTYWPGGHGTYPLHADGMVEVLAENGPQQ